MLCYFVIVKSKKFAIFLLLQIPDEHAEKLITPEHIVKYVSEHEIA
jgi:hypothetical protein